MQTSAESEKEMQFSLV